MAEFKNKVDQAISQFSIDLTRHLSDIEVARKKEKKQLVKIIESLRGILSKMEEANDRAFFNYVNDVRLQLYNVVSGNEETQTNFVGGV